MGSFWHQPELHDAILPAGKRSLKEDCYPCPQTEVTKDKPYKSWALAMCLVAVTISLILLLPGRAIELTLKSVGTIKAAAQQASADANVISDLRNRIERQSAAIDSVAQQANTSLKLEEQLSDKAASAVKKIDDLNKTLTVANNQMLSGIKSLAGTDSFAYVIPQPTDKDGNVPLAIRSVGKNILHWSEVNYP